MESRVDGDFLFSDDNHLDVINTTLASSTWSGSRNGRFAEGSDPCKRMTLRLSVLVVSSHPIAETVAHLAMLDGEGDAILNNVGGSLVGNRSAILSEVLVCR